MSKRLDIQKLAAAIKAKREFHNLGLRKAAEIIGISFPTLSRVEKENIPDLITFLKLCDWLEIDSNEFIVGESSNALSQEQIFAHFRASIDDTKTIELLETMIRTAYQLQHQ